MGYVFYKYKLYDVHISHFVFNFDRKVGPFRKRPLYENTVEMNTVDYAIPANYDTMLNTDNGSVPNVYINSDTDENQYDRID